MTLLVILTAAILVLLLTVYAGQHEQNARLGTLSQRLDELARRSLQLDAIAATVAEIEDRTAPPLERASRDFDRGQPLTAEIVGRLSPGNVIRIVEKSWHYPARDPFIFEFDFEFGSLGDATSDGSERPVLGRRRLAYSEPWDNYEFTIGPDGAVTRDRAGTIRGIIRPMMDDPLVAALEPRSFSL